MTPKLLRIGKLYLMTRIILLLLLFVSSLSVLTAQGIKGTIKTDAGEILPFASIYVKEIGSGTSTNLEGYYELKLKAGEYEITYQFMGYKTQVRKVTVGSQIQTFNIAMETQVVSLATVTVIGKQEDPSYTIMRKAIAKAKYHLIQFDEYSADVYIKGTGSITKIPWFVRKRLAKEGIDTSQVFTSESVSEINFKRPNVFSEKVISVRSSGEDNANASPNSYISSSFYLPKMVESISPLSPRAFSYYKFKYEGSFRERGYEINKIKVTPRSRGDNLFEGDIYIREDFWNIHSVDLTTSITGFIMRIQQIFAPIEGEIWMPVTQQFDFSGSIFGFGGAYKYLASLSNYNVTKNSDLDETVILIDEKIEAAPEEIEAIKSKDVEAGVNEVFKEEKEVSRKQFRKLMKDYEKQEREELPEPDMLSVRTYKVDSLAYKKDSIYWASMRPVPLTSKEIQGYERDDSTFVADKEKALADTNRLNNGERFKPMQLFTGSYYKLGKRLRFSYPGVLPKTRFNTVEGLNFDFGGTFRWRNDTTTRLRITPNLRYGFSSNTLYGKVETVFGIGETDKRNTFRVSGGKYIEQFNPNAIDDLINTFFAVTTRQSFMKLYQKDYAKASYGRRFNYKFTFSGGVEWANRTELFNNTTWSIFKPDGREYTTNGPINKEVITGGFVDAKAFIANVNLTFKPWVKFRSYNGRIYPVENNAPTFRLSYRKGVNDVFGSDVDFDHVEIGTVFDFDIGVRAKIDFEIEAGKFLGTPSLEFMDFKHFQGNRLILAPLDVTGGYRMLDYYENSTAQEYLSVYTHIKFRKFLLTQMPMLRLSGLKENLFVNYLSTPTSQNYTEVGYTIDNIFRIFRLEFVQSFRDWEASEFNIRIGVAALFGDN